ncbi:MAG: hypothetical protein DPW09_03265 [Anaerolineae bacterium]|nr:VWA domain-containing protein [Anaerolineales bacterium]MCQ3972450.1 hypothetical protein [Anaerolineae bacterium]
MLRKILLNLKARHLKALNEQKGQSIIIFTFAFIGLIAMLGLALDLGLVYIERVKVGRTTDAGVLAGVSELSNNNEEATIDRVVEYIRLNGYDVGGDTEILVRGCLATPPVGYTNPGNYYEKGLWTATTPVTATNLITGATYIPAASFPPKASFVIDTGAYQVNPTGCNPAGGGYGGSSQKVRVSGRVNVHMNFMQFFGFGDVPVADEGIAENVTTLDIVIVFDISGSMEDQTICHDCWVRTTYQITGTPYPGNGYFNPLPYDPALAGKTLNDMVPASKLCTEPPTPWIRNSYKYLTMEAELYSAYYGNWTFDARTGGVGFWALQRGSRGTVFPAGFEGAGGVTNDQNEEDYSGYYQGNQAGNPDYQSSNVCWPAQPSPAVDCILGSSNNDDICSSGDGGIIRDCSAYIATRPFNSYGQSPGAIPNLNGGSYNLDCFKAGAGPFDPNLNPVLSQRCWTNDRVPGSNPFFAQTGPGPGNVPWVEYDFTPTWTEPNTYIWIRAIGGNKQSFTWAGESPDDLDSTPSNNLSAWRKVVFWQINNGQVFEQNDNNNSSVLWYDAGGDWRDNRAQADSWRWVKLGSTPTVSGTQYTLKLYQGSSGYKIDKIIFTNDASGSTGSPPEAMRLQRNSSSVASSDGRLAVGPPASYGSATREACNLCNPIYGNSVSSAACSCLKNNVEASQRYLPSYPGYNPALVGSGAGCYNDPQLSIMTGTQTITVTPAGVLPAQTQTRIVVNDLFSGNQPLRSAQEAVKNFVLGNGVEEKYRLKPGFDQVGFVPFSPNAITTADNRAKLECLRSTVPTPLDPAICYAKVLRVVERQWPRFGTNISEGMREGLEELGISVGSNTVLASTCTTTANDMHACDRGGAAKRVLILMTDGSPNASVSSCSSQSGYADYWDGLIGKNDPDFDCAMWYAQQAAKNGVVVYTIGIGGGANRDFLWAMATGVDPRGGTGNDEKAQTMFPGSGGRYFGAAKPSDLDGIFRQILTSISVRIVG